MKAYKNAFGEGSLEIARAAVSVSSQVDVRIILVAPALSAAKVNSVYPDVYLQHADPLGFGAYTGFTPVEAASIEGLKGVMANHSEHKLVYRDVSRIVAMAAGAGLETLLCADTPGEAAGLAYLSPTMIAVEPPELIGTGIPVSKARPEVISKAVEAVASVSNKIPVLAGAGITSGEDAARSIELGARGVLVASAVMKADSPRDKLLELAEGLTRR
ncbi:MAG: triose-phosphate isomerase [Aeropyrum sp.]|nr:triose-phosphate isomerase [Aeropyrum sp.]